ncbi:aminoglycoside phosphotransferase family protein [Nocardia abscessus]|uniref:aminoglycoside phosphotransferase family protein n=1 Tax=Nocardia abscessus TaxID=120957 RepID=UPI0024540D7C|nr:aminoglycoside phosphotransferase family protein [Nocardia abscessus]
MTTESQLPGRTAVRAACQEFGVDDQDAQLLHHRSNAVWLLPHADLVVRLAPDTAYRRERAHTAVAVTRWLAAEPLPIALTPASGTQPVIANGAIATFWPYRPSPGRPGPADLGTLVRRLHSVARPPFPVPRYQPLRRLFEALDLDDERTTPALSDSERAWVRARAEALVGQFAQTEFPLGEGLVHVDVHSENAVCDHGQWVLIDWDQCSIGPRELDLVNGLPDHFHQPQHERARFAAAYGYDLLDWLGWTLLRDITELHSLGAYIRLAPSKPAADEELRHRLLSLRADDRAVVWQAVS